jgi:NADP-dependent 3-hydroxy acid dehydrogenase YdfG
VVNAGVEAFGQIDILVTNCGGPPAGPFEQHGPDAWAKAVRETLSSAVNFARAVLPGMKERGWGRIINITSIAVKQPVDGQRGGRLRSNSQQRHARFHLDRPRRGARGAERRGPGHDP